MDQQKSKNDGLEDLSLPSMLGELRRWLRESHDSGKLWDIIGALRGPDRGQGEEWSERPCDRGERGSEGRYSARVERKLRTVAIIRGESGLYGGSARTRRGSAVTLPPQSEWDHFDKHVARAAQWLRLKVNVMESTPKTHSRAGHLNG